MLLLRNKFDQAVLTFLVLVMAHGMTGSVCAQSQQAKQPPAEPLPLSIPPDLPTVPSEFQLKAKEYWDREELLLTSPQEAELPKANPLESSNAEQVEAEEIAPEPDGAIPNALESLSIPLVDGAFVFPDTNLPEVPSGDIFASDHNASPWWKREVLQSGGSAEFRLELEELVWLAVAHSPTIQSLLIEPQILDARAAGRLGEFDMTNFVDSIFRDTSEPVGNTLTTGGPPRLNDALWENRAGVRGRNQYGGQAEFFQEMLFKDSNSLFFDPQDQSDTRMVLRYTQPLVRGRGKEYNRASFVVASVAANQSKYQTAYALQEHAMRLTNAYWDIYAASAMMIQNRRGIEKLQRLRDQLQGRQELDSLKSQILRAEAAIYKQNAALALAQAQRQVAEANLKAAVGSPALRDSKSPIVPITPVFTIPLQIDHETQRAKALQHHPKIRETTETIRSARVQLHVAEHELKPTLNLVLEGYLRGLNGDYDAIQSLGDQFSTTPSYHTGLVYQRPRKNIAAQAILREKRLELRRALLRLDETLLNVSAEVEGAIAAVQSAYQQLDAAIRSTQASEAEVEYLEAIWNDAFVGNSRASSLQLDQLLSANIQVIYSQNSWAQAERDYMLALARLQLATGSLLPANF